MLTFDKQKLTSINAWKLEPEASSYAKPGTSNKDMDPTRPEDRTWSTTDYIAYWLADALNVSTWEMGSSMLTLGLSIRYALPCIFLGHCIIAIPICLQGTTGAILHVPFPIQSRSSFGHHLSKFAIISRLVLAWFWFGVQCYTGAQAIEQMIIALAPSFRTFKNTLPENSNITSRALLCYFLFWFIQFPLLLIHPKRIQWFFKLKSILVPICFVSMFIWALTKAGTGPIFKQKATISGSELGWAFMSSLSAVLGNFSTLAVNIPDFTRYAKSPRAQYVQVGIIPFAFTLCAFIGIVVTSAAEVIYNEVYWNPNDLVGAWADDSKSRAARFFVGFCFALATMGTNISANSISAANDITALLPRYFNIRRGSILCAFLGGWCLTPWNILAKALTFLSFMSGYTVFLAPICGILVADYWVVRRGRIDVPSLYLGKEGRYYYNAGVNWRALVALVVCIAPTLPGLANSINANIKLNDGLSNLFKICWLFGFTVSIAVYSILCKIFPDSESYVSRAILADDVDIPGYTSTTINREGSSSPQLALDDNEKDTINKDKGNGSAVRVQAV